MAKTKQARKNQKTLKAREPEKAVEWSPQALIKAIAESPIEEDIACLKAAGILTSSGELASKYKSWGNKVSRTPTIDETGKMQG